MKIRVKFYILLPCLLLCLIARYKYGYCGFNMEPDKKLHLGAGVITGSGSYYICPEIEEFVTGQSYVHPVIWSTGMASLAGAGKEIVYDGMMHRGYSDVYDFYYTLAGGMISGLTLCILENIFACPDTNLSIEAYPADKKIFISYSLAY